MTVTKIEFTDKEVTAHGGIILLQKMLEQMKFTHFLERTPLPQPGSNRGYDPVQIILQFIVSVWCGANRYEHLEVARFDGVLQQLFGWERMAGHRAFVRFFQKFTMKTNSRVFPAFYKWFFDNLSFDNYTLDFDSSVITRYGEQQGAAVGYNAKKPGRKSHHPLMAFVSDVQMVANFWLRSGDAHTANNFEAFMESTLANLQNKQIGLLRADSGFYSKKIFELLENRAAPVSYIIACPLYTTIQRHIQSQKTWLQLDNGIEICATHYQSPMWDAPRRLIIVRQEIAERPKATGKTLRLFEDDDIVSGYRHSCYITNLKLPAAEVWRLYRGRANCENQIKELKYDYAVDKMNQNSFDATETTMNFIMIAYNLMSLFKQVVIPTKAKPMLKTIRYTTLNIGSYIVKNGRDSVLKMSLQMKQRKWIRQLWANIDNIKQPFIIIDS
ncbi:IS1380 family transposase [Arachidicoccus soli]|uniref:IS1380 family transposase n=1 Tax=Arachidicoccus soli TaxID=2341117 RepID=A0A386HMG5_9BACT|nr:IS1380 family transposase [Arachidicoccus soli]AYD46706.1 IS1380 family transposase [Arachidicoccus soli]AYD46933.1 IS1380 family transposase [Arachidicoccus soli]AYD47039.1 IS1380 family transposase [Arachidicoccus soli]AYD48147.1 IS1380 family transposase [Arachidicoccus soli]